MVEWDPMLVHEYDHIYMTGLLWAGKKNHERIVRYLMDHHADPMAKDLLERDLEYFVQDNPELLKAVKLKNKPESLFSKANFKRLQRKEQLMKSIEDKKPPQLAQDATPTLTSHPTPIPPTKHQVATKTTSSTK